MRHGAARVKLDATAADKLRPLAKLERRRSERTAVIKGGARRADTLASGGRPRHAAVIAWIICTLQHRWDVALAAVGLAPRKALVKSCRRGKTRSRASQFPPTIAKMRKDRAAVGGFPHLARVQPPVVITKQTALR
jgi:hypothetical protein